MCERVRADSRLPIALDFPRCKRAHSLRALINRRAIPPSGIKQPPLLAAISHAIRNGRPSKARDDRESVEPRESILVARLGTLRFATSIARPFH